MKLPFVKRSEYDDLKKELDVALDQMKQLETALKYVNEVCKRWQMKRVGNLRAISTIAKLFNPRTAKEDK